MALVCQGVVSQLRNGAMAAKLGFLKLWGFRRAFRSYEMRLEAAKWRSCAKGVFCSCENFHRRGHGATKSFRSQGAFLQPSPDFATGFLGISQPRAIFAGASFGLPNLADHGFSLALEFLLTPKDLPSISSQFLLHEIIQKD